MGMCAVARTVALDDIRHRDVVVGTIVWIDTPGYFTMRAPHVSLHKSAHHYSASTIFNNCVAHRVANKKAGPLGPLNSLSAKKACVFFLETLNPLAALGWGQKLGLFAQGCPLGLPWRGLGLAVVGRLFYNKAADRLTARLKQIGMWQGTTPVLVKNKEVVPYLHSKHNGDNNGALVGLFKQKAGDCVGYIVFDKVKVDRLLVFGSVLDGLFNNDARLLEQLLALA